MAQKHVLITGAAGMVAGRILPDLRKRYELTLLDITRQNSRAPEPVEDITLVDLMEHDSLKPYRPYFEGVHTVIHLARIPPERGASKLDQGITRLRELKLAYRVYRLAFEAGVERFLNASTNHATDWQEDQLHAGKRDFIGPYEKALADNFYGYARESSEHMGFVFACGSLGRQMGVVQLRIGGPREFTWDEAKGRPHSYKRRLGAYISARDLSQLVVKSIETEDLGNPVFDGIPFHIFYGVSNNTRRFWDISNARQAIGYDPEDDSELLFADDVARFKAECDVEDVRGAV